MNIVLRDWNFQIIELAKLVSRVLGDIPLSIQIKYLKIHDHMVDFSLFKISSNFQPRVKIEGCIEKLYSMIKNNISVEDYNARKLIRLSYLKGLIEKNKINKELTWIKQFD